MNRQMCPEEGHRPLLALLRASEALRTDRLQGPSARGERGARLLPKPHLVRHHGTRDGRQVVTLLLLMRAPARWRPQCPAADCHAGQGRQLGGVGHVAKDGTATPVRLLLLLLMLLLLMLLLLEMLLR